MERDGPAPAGGEEEEMGARVDQGGSASSVGERERPRMCRYFSSVVWSCRVESATAWPSFSLLTLLLLRPLGQLILSLPQGARGQGRQKGLRKEQ